MTTLIQQFLGKVKQIYAEKPKYRQPGDASDGTCDCIGLVIGALKRMGIKWGGIHGTNYAVRQASVNFRRITDASQLEVGDAVYKAYEKGDAKWTLNKYPRYLSGGAFYNGDLRDYYHVGVVASVNPLQIYHMTSPTVKIDTKLGKWGYAARIKQLVNAGAYNGSSAKTPTVETPAQEKTEPVKVSTAVVTAASGKTVKMRMKPSTNCNMYDNVPIGATVTLVEYGNEWCKISYGRRSGWYMMTKFLKL